MFNNNHFLFFLCILCSMSCRAHCVTLSDMAQGGAVGFPRTIEDVPRDIRIANQRAGYEVYKDSNPYHNIEVQNMIEPLENRRVADEQTLSRNEYCNIYPTDMERCNPTNETFEEIYAVGNSESAVNNTGFTNLLPYSETPNETGGNEIVEIYIPEQTPPITSVQPVPDVTNTVSGDHRKVHGGTCTPPDASDWFTNKILTTGKYQSIDPAFEKALINNFRVEGGCGTDVGGYTCYGISAKGNPDIDIGSLTPAKVEDITYTKYYKNINIDSLPDYVRGDVMRASFSAGQYTGIKQFQKTLGINQSGKITNEVVVAAENYSGDLHNNFWDTMQQYYGSLAKKPKYSPYLKGWMNMVKLFRDNGCHVQPKRPLYR